MPSRKNLSCFFAISPKTWAKVFVNRVSDSRFNGVNDQRGISFQVWADKSTLETSLNITVGIIKRVHDELTFGRIIFVRNYLKPGSLKSRGKTFIVPARQVSVSRR